MYRQIFIPSNKENSIKLPRKFYGKKVEVIAFVIKEEKQTAAYNKKNEEKSFLADIEYIPDFPDIEEIRRSSWPQKKW